MNNCHIFLDRLDEYLEGALADSAYDAAAAHLQHCAACQRRVARAQALRAALRSVPVPAPRSGFFDQALARAHGPNRARRTGWMYLTGAALAASLALWIGAGRLPLSLNTAGPKPIGVTIALHETRTVQLAFNAERDLPQARLSIRLPKGIELKGFPGRREVSWQANIARGANLLSLPLTALSTAGGTLLARVEHGDRSTELTIPLHVTAGPHAAATPAASAAILGRDSTFKETTHA